MILRKSGKDIDDLGTRHGAPARNVALTKTNMLISFLIFIDHKNVVVSDAV